MSYSLIDRLKCIPLAFVDVETTGASPEWGDRVIEIGIVRIEGGQVVAEYQQLVDPERYIGAGIIALTGITPLMVAGQPRFADIAPRVIELLSGAVIVGHNVRFDLSFIRSEIRRALRRELHEALGPQALQVMDTVRIARKRFGRGGNGLQRLAPRLGIAPTDAHRALADAQTTAAVFERLLEPVGGWNLMLCDAIQQQGGPMGIQPPGTSRDRFLPLELEEALEARGAVMMEYVDAREQRTERVIEPIQVRRFKTETVLVAHCHLRNDRRTFKLDRIVRLTRMEVEPTTPQPCPPSDIDVEIPADESALFDQVLSPSTDRSVDQSDTFNATFPDPALAPQGGVS